MNTDPKPKRTGTIFRYVQAKPGERQGHYVVRCSAPDGSRPLFHLDPSDESERAAAAARKTAEAISEELWAKGLGAAPKRARAQRHEPEEPVGGMPAWLALWLVERKKRGYTSTPENASHYREHIEPAIGPKHVRDWTADDLRLLTRVLDAKVQACELSWKTAANVWGTATKICKDASTSKQEALRVRTDNPAQGVLGPDRSARTVKQYLYRASFCSSRPARQCPSRGDGRSRSPSTSSRAPANSGYCDGRTSTSSTAPFTYTGPEIG
ncbi:MAG: hypothetical protein QM756_11165 [Polyangiaceae bacterium]